MKRFQTTLLLNTCLALFFLLLAGWALAQQDAPEGPSTVYRSTFEDAHRFDVVHLILAFEPGAWTPLHTHGGVAYVTVLEGQMIVREEGQEEQDYGPGETWIEYPGLFAEVGNEGAGSAQIFATFLLPRGAALTGLAHANAAGDTPPGPTVVHRSDFEDAAPLAEFDVIHMVLEFAPDAWTPVHTHGGEAFVTVLEGHMRMRMENGEEANYAAGDQWLEVPGEFAAVGNPGTENARIAVTFLLPHGEPLTTTR